MDGKDKIHKDTSKEAHNNSNMKNSCLEEMMNECVYIYIYLYIYVYVFAFTHQKSIQIYIIYVLYTYISIHEMHKYLINTPKYQE